MARTKKQVFETVEQVKEYLTNNYTFAKLVDELAQFKFEKQNQPKTSTTKITLSQEDFDRFFHIKESKGRGRKKKVADENKGE